MDVRRVVVAAGAALALAAGAGPALADATYPPTGPTQPAQVQPSVSPTSAVLPEHVTRTGAGGGLPFTGEEIAAITLAGVALLAGGGVLVTTTRRRRSRAS